MQKRIIINHGKKLIGSQSPGFNGYQCYETRNGLMAISIFPTWYSYIRSRAHQFYNWDRSSSFWNYEPTLDSCLQNPPCRKCQSGERESKTPDWPCAWWIMSRGHGWRNLFPFSWPLPFPRPIPPSVPAHSAPNRTSYTSYPPPIPPPSRHRTPSSHLHPLHHHSKPFRCVHFCVHACSFSISPMTSVHSYKEPANPLKWPWWKVMVSEWVGRGRVYGYEVVIVVAFWL